MKKQDAEIEKQAFAAEAERLALLSLDDQKTFVGILQKLGRDHAIPDEERLANHRRAAALTKLLGLK